MTVCKHPIICKAVSCPSWHKCQSGCLNSAFLNISQHFTAHLFRPWIPNSTRGIDSGPRQFTEVVLNEQSLPVTGSGRVSRRLLTRPSSATAGLPVLDRWRVTWRPPVGRAAGTGEPRRTKRIRNESSRDQRAFKTNFAACPGDAPDIMIALAQRLGMARNLHGNWPTE